MGVIDTIGLLITGGIIGALIAYFIEALRAPYPINRFEYFIRRYLTKSNIKGKNFGSTDFLMDIFIPSDHI